MSNPKTSTPSSNNLNENKAWKNNGIGNSFTEDKKYPLKKYFQYFFSYKSMIISSPIC